MLFTVIMNNKKIYVYSGLILLFFTAWILTDSNKKNDDFSEIAKVALRDVGHQLLTSNSDATSTVLPIVEVEKFKYKLDFQNQLSFEPSNLVSVVANSIKKARLPNYYRVEVVQCSDGAVAYSYQISASEENTIIPCAGRYLTNGCYTIEVKFTHKVTPFFSKRLLLYVLLFSMLIFLLDYLSSVKKEESDSIAHPKPMKLGVFQFYPEQNKLVKQAEEISLSKKECELLAIFVANPNQIIKRDELTKKVWEDNGVFVGRSLDTYISKLRKKLKDDEAIKLTNIHGVGYKLEIG